MVLYNTERQLHARSQQKSITNLHPSDARQLRLRTAIIDAYTHRAGSTRYPGVQANLLVKKRRQNYVLSFNIYFNYSSMLSALSHFRESKLNRNQPQAITPVSWWVCSHAIDQVRFLASCRKKEFL